MEDRVIARLQVKDKRFEIFVDCEKAMLIRDGKSADISSALLVDRIFKDVKTGEVAGNLENVFGTSDVKRIAMEIIKRGEVQLSSAYRDKQLSMLKNRIIEEISSMAIDATTNIPIPRKRIELALQEVHCNFDLNKPEKEQVEDILTRLKKVLPIKLGEFSYAADIPIQYSNEAMLYLKRLASIKSNTRNENAMSVNFSVKAGNEAELLNKLKSVTHGNVTIKKL